MSRIDFKLNIILVLAAMLVIFVLCLSSCGGNNDTDPASSTPSQISTGQSASQTQRPRTLPEPLLKAAMIKARETTTPKAMRKPPITKPKSMKPAAITPATAAMIKTTRRQAKKPYLRQKAMKAAERRRTTSPKPKAAGQAKTIKKL